MSLNTTFLSEIDSLINSPQFESFPRGQKVRENLNSKIEIFARDRVVGFKERKLSYKYLAAELIWYINGSCANTSRTIGKYAGMWNQIAYNDFVNSNYGSRILQPISVSKEQHPYHRGLMQLENIVNLFVNDPDTRQAILTVFHPLDLTKTNTVQKDIPCTLTLQFFIRDNHLHLIVNMRSNDIIYGFTNDVFQFTMIQEMIMHLLRAADSKFADLQLGYYMHNAGSMHIYEKHFEMGRKILEEQDPVQYNMIPMDAFNADIARTIVQIENYLNDKNYDTAACHSVYNLLISDDVPELTEYWKMFIKGFLLGDAASLYKMLGVAK